MVKGVLSEPSSVSYGIPRGSVIDPLLFLIIIDDIDVDTTSSFISSFIRDTSLLQKDL